MASEYTSSSFFVSWLLRCLATNSATALVYSWLRDILRRRASISAERNTGSGIEIAVFILQVQLWLYQVVKASDGPYLGPLASSGTLPRRRIGGRWRVGGEQLPYGREPLS